MVLHVQCRAGTNVLYINVDFCMKKYLHENKANNGMYS